MNRRDAVLALAALSALRSTGALAQSPNAPRLRHVAVVYNGSPESSRSFRDALAEGLAGHGYRDGENLKVEPVYVQFQWDRMPEILQKVVAGKPDVIVVSGSPG